MAGNFYNQYEHGRGSLSSIGSGSSDITLHEGMRNYNMLPNADSPGQAPAAQQTGSASGGSGLIPVPQLTNAPWSQLGGTSFENARGRFLCLYWQTAQDDIYESCFRRGQGMTWSLSMPPTLVGTAAKPGSPIAAVAWGNGLMRWVYYLNEWNIIRERMTYNGGETWVDGTIPLVPTRSDSDLAATVRCKPDNHLILERRVYYQSWSCKIKQITFTEPGSQLGSNLATPTPASHDLGWHISEEGSRVPLAVGSAGTSIVVLTRKADTLYITSSNRKIEQYPWTPPESGARDRSPAYILQGPFDRADRIKGCSLSYSNWIRLYIHNGNHILQTLGDTKAAGWQPSGKLIGSNNINENFIAMEWGFVDGDQESEVHLFSVSNGMVHDYLVGASNSHSFLLVQNVNGTYGAPPFRPIVPGSQPRRLLPELPGRTLSGRSI